MRKIALISVVSFFVTLLFITGFSRPSDAQTYYGCYITNNGTEFRIVTGPGRCKKNETEISWNSIGPKGDTGATGDMGPQGPAGPQGPPGSASTETQEVKDLLCDYALRNNIQPCPSFCFCPKTVFVSSARYRPRDLGGLDGADATCQSLADAAGLQGTFKAWLSSSTLDARDRLTHGNGSYMRVDGATIAANWADLTDGELDAPINISEDGVYYTPPFPALTGTTASGFRASGTSPVAYCYDWTGGNFENYVLHGDPSWTSSMWSQANFLTCITALRLYCFQQ